MQENGSLNDMTARREPVFNLPSAVAGISLCLLAVHLVRMVVFSDDFDWEVIVRFGFIPAQIFYGPLEGHSIVEGWGLKAVPFLSYAFLHGDLLHLGFNTLWLVAMGSPVERLMGAGRFCAFAAIGAILAAVFYGVFNAHSEAPMIGASGAVSAMMGGLVRFMFAAGRRTGRSSQSGLLLFAGIWIALNVFTGTMGIGPTGGVQSIAWEAHVGGFLAGALLLPVFARRGGLDPRTPRLRETNDDR